MMPPRRGAAAVVGTVTESRRVAADVCADLRAGDLLDGAFERRAAALDARDRRWALELVAGMLRRRAWLDAVVGGFVTGGLARLDPDVTDLLRLGAQQLTGMDRVPASAAIAQTVELAKVRHGRGAAGLVNAVLRRIDRERATLAPAEPGDPIEALALRHSHPRWLVARWAARWGADEAARLLAANNTLAPVIVRPFGIGFEPLEAMLEASDVPVTDAPLVRDSLQLGPGVALTELGAFRQGRFIVQDPAATLVVHYAAVPAGALVLDACAAPGGKTLELAKVAGHVVAADRQPARAARLQENVTRVGATNVEVRVADAREPGDGTYDVVLVDAPCTGTGTFRRHPDARWRLKVSDLAVMGALQRSLLAALAPTVRPGGLLVYSTCSLEPEENDVQVEHFLAAHPDFTLEPPPEGAVPPDVLDGGRLRVLPQRHGTDGAFAARLRRRA
ncbi:MAG: 16S rRNA (cytosine(967)-C(5))-methyltransferase RsmB [Gemmatimonadota bacterium]